MAKLSTFLEQKILEHVFKGDLYTPPNALYISLHTEEVLDDASGAEVTGQGYQRRLVSFTDVVQIVNGSEIENDALVIFGPTQESWGTVTHIGVFDAYEEGNLLVWGELIVPRETDTNQVLSFQPGDLKVRLD
jgi:hypothetical protein